MHTIHAPIHGLCTRSVQHSHPMHVICVAIHTAWAQEPCCNSQPMHAICAAIHTVWVHDLHRNSHGLCTQSVQQFTVCAHDLCNSHRPRMRSVQQFTQPVHATVQQFTQSTHAIHAIHTVCESTLCSNSQFVHTVLAAIHTVCARDLCGNSAHVHSHLVCSAHRPWAGTPQSSLIPKKATQLQGGRCVCLHTLLGLSAPTVDSRPHHMPGLQGGPHTLLQ